MVRDFPRRSRPALGPTHSCTMGTGSFPGVKRPRRGADHPPPSKYRGHERVGLYLYSPSRPSWPVRGWKFNLFTTCQATLYNYPKYSNTIKINIVISRYILAPCILIEIFVSVLWMYSLHSRSSSSSTFPQSIWKFIRYQKAPHQRNDNFQSLH